MRPRLAIHDGHDLEQDKVLATLRAAQVPPPNDLHALREHHARVESKHRKERRRRKRTVSLEDLKEEPSVPSFLEAVMAAESLRSMMEAASPRHRLILQLIVVGETPAREVARTLNLTISAVRRLRERAVAALGDTAIP